MKDRNQMCAVFLTTIRDPQKRAGLIELHPIYILKSILDQSIINPTSHHRDTALGSLRVAIFIDFLKNPY